MVPVDIMPYFDDSILVATYIIVVRAKGSGNLREFPELPLQSCLQIRWALWGNVEKGVLCFSIFSIQLQLQRWILKEKELHVLSPCNSWSARNLDNKNITVLYFYLEL